MNVRSMRGGLLAVGLAAGLATPAGAGIYADDLSKCLVRSMTPGDQQAFVQWVFSAMALHPQVAPYSNISAEQRKAFNTQAAALMQRLLTVDCRKESVDALKYEGVSALEPAFSVAGEVAMRGLMSDPAVAKGLEGFGAGFDEAKLRELYAEAGVKPTTK